MDISTYTKIIFKSCDSKSGATYTSIWRRGSTICGDFQRFFCGGDEQIALRLFSRNYPAGYTTCRKLWELIIVWRSCIGPVTRSCASWSCLVSSEQSSNWKSRFNQLQLKSSNITAFLSYVDKMSESAETIGCVPTWHMSWEKWHMVLTRVLNSLTHCLRY